MLKLENMPEILSIEEVAEYLGVSYSAIYKLTEQNEIVSFRVGSKIRIRKTALIQFIENQEKLSKNLIVLQDEPTNIQELVQGLFQSN